MSSLLERTRAAIDFASEIRFLVPSTPGGPLGPALLARATSLFAEHLDALAPHASAALPEPRVEPHTRVVSVWQRLGLGDLRPTTPAVSEGPSAPVVLTSPGSMNRPAESPPSSAETRTWAQAVSKLWTHPIDRMRTDSRARDRLRGLERAFGVRPEARDPYQAHQEILREPLRIARWEHPHAGPSARVPSIMEKPHQTAAFALESHLLWLAGFFFSEDK